MLHMWHSVSITSSSTLLVAYWDSTCEWEGILTDCHFWGQTVWARKILTDCHFCGRPCERELKVLTVLSLRWQQEWDEKNTDWLSRSEADRVSEILKYWLTVLLWQTVWSEKNTDWLSLRVAAGVSEKNTDWLSASVVRPCEWEYYWLLWQHVWARKILTSVAARVSEKNTDFSVARTCEWLKNTDFCGSTCEWDKILTSCGSTCEREKYWLLWQHVWAQKNTDFKWQARVSEKNTDFCGSTCEWEKYWLLWHSRVSEKNTDFCGSTCEWLSLLCQHQVSERNTDFCDSTCEREKYWLTVTWARKILTDSTCEREKYWLWLLSIYCIVFLLQYFRLIHKGIFSAVSISIWFPKVHYFAFHVFKSSSSL